jgi:hypothetical protein
LQNSGIGILKKNTGQTIANWDMNRFHEPFCLQFSREFTLVIAVIRQKLTSNGGGYVRVTG